MISWRCPVERISINLILLVFVLILICGCAQIEKTPLPVKTNTPTFIPTSTIITTLIPTSTYIPTPMPEDLRKQLMDEYSAAVEPILSEWYVNIEKINEVRYQSLVDELIRLRFEFASLEIDPYFDNLHARMVQHMDCQVASYLALIGPEGVYMMNLDLDPSFYFENCTYNFE
jgi:hypothetical protein